jgi:single-strand DNA-binding protein
MQDSSITVTGNLVADPQLRIVASGAPVCSFRIGVTPRHKDGTGQWVDGTSMFLSVSCWRTLAENAHVTLHRGDRVLVIGRPRQRAYTTQLGEERVVWEIDADVVAPDLSRHTAVLSRPHRRVPSPDPQPGTRPGTRPTPDQQPVAA